MYNIEPFYLWIDNYNAAEDELSPFFNHEYSEFEFSNAIYDHYIHPQWDSFGSATLFLKLLFADYEKSFCVIELMGEWNDCLYNDIMYLKREVIEILIANGINKFILIGENVLNFHYSDDCYYEEWLEEIENGWIMALNFREHVIAEFKTIRLDNYIIFEEELMNFNWRKFNPYQLFERLETLICRRLPG